MGQFGNRIAYNESKVYAFTNENLTSFKEIYDFEGRNILTVLGSGDQYFACKLFGAEKVEVYDSNPKTWPYFVLKFYSIAILSYEDFKILFVENPVCDFTILNKVLPYLPHDVLTKLRNLLDAKSGLESRLIYSPISNHSRNYATGIVIPYFDREEYYRLQTILRNTLLPKVHIGNFLDLPKTLDNIPRDLLTASNIFKWLTLSPEEYDEFLSTFKIDTIQAYYAWYKDIDLMKCFQNMGYNIDFVEHPSPLTTEKNMIITKINH